MTLDPTDRRPVRKHRTAQTGLEFVTEVSELASIELDDLTSPAAPSAREVR